MSSRIMLPCRITAFQLMCDLIYLNLKLDCRLSLAFNVDFTFIYEFLRQKARGDQSFQKQYLGCMAFFKGHISKNRWHLATDFGK